MDGPSKEQKFVPVSVSPALTPSGSKGKLYGPCAECIGQGS